MVTIILLNIALGTISLAGPVISGIFTGLLAGTRDLAMAIAFWGAVIGGVLCRVFFNYAGNIWHHYLLNLFGKTAAHYTELVIRGNLFFLALYFGLTGVLGTFIGAFLKNKIKKLIK